MPAQSGLTAHVQYSQRAASHFTPLGGTALKRANISGIAVAGLCLGVLSFTAKLTGATTLSSEQEILTILQPKCARCHGPESHFDAALKGMQLNVHAMVQKELIKPGNAEDSEVYDLAKRGHDYYEKFLNGLRPPEKEYYEDAMPPDDPLAVPLTEAELEKLKTAIAQLSANAGGDAQSGSRAAENSASEEQNNKRDSQASTPAPEHTSASSDHKAPDESKPANSDETKSGSEKQTPLKTGDDDISKEAVAALQSKCLDCHGGKNGAKKGVNIKNIERLINTGKIKPGDPDHSAILNRAELGAKQDENGMPPPDKQDMYKPMTETELAAVRKWIISMPAKGSVVGSSGSEQKPEHFVSNSQILAAVAADLENQPRQRQKLMRYFTITHLLNAGASEQDLALYRQGFSKLINSLSFGKRIVVPVPVDPNQTILRIDLSSYEWQNRDIWQKIAYEYPYKDQFSVSLNQNAVCSATGTDTPIIRADWFVYQASRPDLYYEILGIPKTDKELEKLLTVDLAQHYKDESSVFRAGFFRSGISVSNRIVERHDAAYGAYWKSFDFRDSNGRKNIVNHPLGPPGAAFNNAAEPFDQDGGEIIFNLPNGLQAYMLENSKGQRLDRAPTTIVRDDAERSGEVTAGISCMSCHSAGMIPFTDEISKIYKDPSGAAPNYRIADTVLAIYRGQEEANKVLKEDRQRFLTALTEATSWSPAAVVKDAGDEDPLNKQPGKKRERDVIFTLSEAYIQDVTLANAAAELGMHPADLQDKLRRGSVKLRGRFASLLQDGGQVARSEFEHSYPELIHEFYNVPIGNAGIELPNGGGTMALVPVDSGNFLEGSSEEDKAAQPDEKPAHDVVISRGFQVSETEITQKQWKAVMGTTVRDQLDKHGRHFQLRGEGDDYPMYLVTWHEAVEFCNKLSQPGRLVRLPTEAEWEYICQKGGQVQSHAPSADYSGTERVGGFPANKLGVRGLEGNVAEWCFDTYAPYPKEQASDPIGPAQSDEAKVVRGTAWDDDQQFRCADRARQSPDNLSTSLGFRVVVIEE